MSVTSLRQCAFRNVLLSTAVGILAVGCGSPGVIYSDVRTTEVTDAAGAAELFEAAGNKAVVVNVPVSRVMISMSAAADPLAENQAANRAVAQSDSSFLPAVFSTNSTGLFQPVKGGSQPGGQGGRTPSDNAQGNGGNTGSTSNAVMQTITKNGITYVVSIMPVPSDDLNLRVTPVNDFFSRNDLSVTKIAGTDIPHIVSNQFTDMTSSRIAAIGDLAKTTMGLMAMEQGAATQCDNEVTIDASAEHMQTGADGKPNLVDEGKANCWAYKFVPDAKPHQADVVSRAVFRTQVLSGDKFKAWPIPSCWSGQIALYRSPTAETPNVLLPVKLIDPGFVRLVGIPDKGTITTHPICDADVSDTPVDKWAEAFDVLTALETKASAIAGSQSKSGSSSKPSTSK